MEKKTVNISEQLITSILIALGLSIIIVVIGHTVQSDWKFMPITGNSGQINGGSIPFTLDAKVSSCSYQCMFGAGHFADCSTMTAYDVGRESLPFDEVLSASFDHKSLFLLIALIISAIIYTLKKVNFAVTKEE
jgi:hypothetical protein